MATFTKLRDGSLGVRVNLSVERAVTPGTRLRVEKRDGSTSDVTVDRVVYAKRYGADRYQLCSLVRRAAPVAAAPAPVAANAPDWNAVAADPACAHADVMTYARDGGLTGEGYSRAAGEDAIDRFVADDERWHPTDEPENSDFARGLIDPPAVVVVPTERMLWDGKTRTFTAELSEVRDLIGDGPINVIDVKSQRTGDVVRFTVERVQRDRDGELLAYEYAGPGDLGVKIVFFND